MKTQLKGCNVHWVRSYQRIAERVNAGVVKGSKRAAVEAFCLISKHIMIVNERQQLFNLLCDTSKLSLIQHLRTGQVQVIGLVVDKA